MKSGRKKQMNFELNLVPFIDILSTCICFLLITAVFINLGSMDIKQGLGTENDSKNKNPPSLIVDFNKSGNLEFTIKDVNNIRSNVRSHSLNIIDGRLDWKKIERYLKSVKSEVPDLKTAVIMPIASLKYQHLVQMMEHLKVNQITDIGVSPL